MRLRSATMVFAGATVLVVVAAGSVAQAQDFFNFFGMFRRPPPPPMTSLPYAREGDPATPEGWAPRSRGHSYGGGSQAFCVRTCDGRHFPISNSGNQSKAASCNSFCPASETKVVYGGSIDSAVTDNGKPYSDLPNAFRYRDELVAGCTCNGKDPVGLAEVKIEHDPTLRRGDIVAGPSGLMVAGRGADRRGASLQLSPAPDSIRSRYRHVPVVARQ